MCLEMGADSQGHLHLYIEFEDRLCEILFYLKNNVCVWGWGLLVVGVSLEKTCPVFTPTTGPSGLSPLLSFWPGKAH